jgi:Ser/Thr protein kinase RdoA (MazF antagonist)
MDVASNAGLEALRAGTIGRAIERMRLDVREISMAPDSYSSTVAIVELASGERAVLKVAHNREKFFRELRTLERLDGVLPVPHVMRVWEGDDEIAGAFLLRYIDGEPAGDAIGDGLAFEMGTMLARLHEIPMPGCGYDGENGFVTSGNDWWSFQHGLFLKWSQHCMTVLPLDMMRRCTAHFERIFARLPDAGPDVLVHMDYRPGNILVRGNRVAALIDFESTRGGSATVDFTKMKIYMWDRFPGTEAAFRDGYRSVRPLPDIDRILPFYLFMNAYGGVAWCVMRNRLDDHYLPENLEALESLLSV